MASQPLDMQKKVFLNTGKGLLLLISLGVGIGVVGVAVEDDGNQQADANDNGHDDVLGGEQSKVVGRSKSGQGDTGLDCNQSVGEHTH